MNTNNRLGNAAVPGDGKPEFLRKFADWVDEWFESQISNCGKFTLSAQTSSALAVTCRALAALIEDLLEEGYSYVLTARFLTDWLEKRFSRYRQMCGGRFLVSLREVVNSEQILMTISLLMEGVNAWEEDLKIDVQNSDLKKLESEVVGIQFQEIELSEKSREVSTYIGGYIVRSILGKEKCKICKTCLVNHSNEEDMQYVCLVSRGGLRKPSVELSQYTSTMFGMLQIIDPIVRKSSVGERTACEHLLKLFGPTPDFVCTEHNEWAGKVANRIIINIFYNNAQKESKDAKRIDSICGFKKRQRTK